VESISELADVCDEGFRLLRGERRSRVMLEIDFPISRGWGFRRRERL
jgi:hypothetical protein